MTAEIFFSKDKKIINKQIQECTHILQHMLWNIFKHYVVQLNSSKPVTSTFIQYLFDGDTFNLRIQCCVLEVL